MICLLLVLKKNKKKTSSLKRQFQSVCYFLRYASYSELDFIPNLIKSETMNWLKLRLSCECDLMVHRKYSVIFSRMYFVTFVRTP